MIEPKPFLGNVRRVQEREPSRYGKVRLDRSERTHPFSAGFIELLRSRLSSDWLTTYPEPEPLYGRFSAHLGQPRERLLFHSGSDQSIKAVFEAYIREGDRILLHRPGYAMYPVYAAMFGARAEYQDFDSDLRFDHDAYIDRIDGGYRMAVLENPNGFVGSAPPPQALERFVDRCEEAGVIALVDEAYYLFHDVTAADRIGRCGNLVVVRTFSKAFGLAGLRAGYTLSAAGNIENLFKVKPMHELNGFAVLAIGALLDRPEEVSAFTRETRASLEFLRRGLAGIGVETSESVANFLAARVGTRLSGERLRAVLAERGILLRRPFREEHLRDWTRIGTGPMEAMEAVLDAARGLSGAAREGG